jgi:ubiquinone/menaquinone biosynthesis C-methylase UbiE
MTMESPYADVGFAGSIPELYDRYMVPMLFEPYAEDLVRRARARPARRVLELAAGTGVVTRALAAATDDAVAIDATDLNRAMLDRAIAIGTCRPVRWSVADAMAPDFGDGAFDLVLCQFGVMFFPDKVRAFGEARRLLEPGGRLLFNVWDRIETSEIADQVTRALAARWPDDPPRFMARTPHGYHDLAAIRRDLAAAGFDAPACETVVAACVAASPRAAAIALCQGTPLRGELEARGPDALAEATRVAEDALTRRYGAGRIEARMSALVVEATR